MPFKPITNNQLGDNIRSAREAKGLSQLALGHLLGWKGDDAGAQVSRYENGLKEPRLSTVVRIVRVLGIDLTALLNLHRK